VFEYAILGVFNATGFFFGDRASPINVVLLLLSVVHRIPLALTADTSTSGAKKQLYSNISSETLPLTRA